MKIIKSFVLVIFAFFALNSSAFAVNTNGTPAQEKQQLRAEVLRHIEGTNLSKLHTKARIKFIVTARNEMVVLNVHTDHRYVERMLKNQLNYKKIKTDLSKKNQIYIVDVTFEVD